MKDLDEAAAVIELSDDMIEAFTQKEGGSDVFLKLVGIDGECLDASHQKEIEVRRFEFAESLIGTTEGGGALRPYFDWIACTCAASKAGPKMFLTCAKGDRIPTAVIAFRKSGGGQQDFMIITLTDAVINHYSQGLDELKEGSVVIFDHVVLGYAKIEFEFKPQNKDGSLGAALKFAFEKTR